MSSVWEKLFGNSQLPANDSQSLPIPYQSGGELSQIKPASAISLGALATVGQGRGGEATPKSLKVARTFNSIGRRNESLRAQLDAVEFSFRNIELIRSQFYDALGPIDQTLVEIERTKVAHLEAERKLEALTDALDRLRGDHAGLTLERNALAAKQEELSARVKDLEKAIAAAESASSEARAALADRSAKLERTERELEDNKRTTAHGERTTAGAARGIRSQGKAFARSRTAAGEPAGPARSVDAGEPLAAKEN